MNETEKSFVGLFLDFLRDPKADARKWESAFDGHKLVQEGLGVFQSCPAIDDYVELQQDIKAKLEEARRSRWDIATRTEIAKRLTDLAIKVPISGVVVPIGGVVTFEPGYHGIDTKTRYAATGMEQASLLALSFISREPDSVIQCLFCKNFALKSGRPVYCSERCQQSADAANHDIRDKNRYLDDPLPLPFVSSIRKPRDARAKTKKGTKKRKRGRKVRGQRRGRRAN